MSLLLFTSACEKPDSALSVLSLNVTPSSILAGQKYNVEAEIRNDSKQTKSFEVPVMVNRVAQDRKSVTLLPGATEKIAFSLRGDNAGIYIVSIGSQSSTLEVRNPIPPAFELSNLEIKPNESNIDEQIVVTADIANVGEIEGEYTAELKINGVADQTKKVIMSPGSSTFILFKISPDSPGIYTIAIDELTGQLTILEPFIPVQITPPVCPPSSQWDPTKKC